MEIIDLNGTGEWSRARLQERYAAYRDAFGLKASALVASEHVEGSRKWFYPVLDDVVRRIKDGDAASIAIGVDLIEEDQGLPFGRGLKSQTANALRHAVLLEEQKARLRKRIVFMLIAGHIPREFREYSKLLRHIGVADLWPELHACVPTRNPYALHYYKTLLANDPTYKGQSDSTGA